MSISLSGIKQAITNFINTHIRKTGEAAGAQATTTATRGADVRGQTEARQAARLNHAFHTELRSSVTRATPETAEQAASGMAAAGTRASAKAVKTQKETTIGEAMGKTFTVRMGGRDVGLQAGFFKDLLGDLYVRGDSSDACIGRLAAKVQARVDNGQGIYTRAVGYSAEVRAGHPASATPQDVSDMMLYLYARSAADNQYFTSGSFNVSDPDGNIMAFLDSCTEKYTRASSHLKGVQKMQVDGHLNVQRGIDIRTGENGLPNGHRTLCYGVVPELRNDSGVSCERRIFLKTESAGCRLNTKGTFLTSAKAGVGEGNRSVHRSDLKETVMHACSFFATRGQQSAAGTRKEHVPNTVKNAYEALCEDKTLSKEMKNLLTFSSPMTGGFGVRQLAMNVDRMISLDPSILERNENLKNLRAAMNGLCQGADPSVELFRRLGNEYLVD